MIEKAELFYYLFALFGAMTLSGGLAQVRYRNSWASLMAQTVVGMVFIYVLAGWLN